MANFKDSFAAARKAGKSKFTWNGKEYNTKLAASGAPKTSPKPTAKPSKAAPKAAPMRPTNPTPTRSSSAPKTSPRPKARAEGAKEMKLAPGTDIGAKAIKALMAPSKRSGSAPSAGGTSTSGTGSNTSSRYPAKPKSEDKPAGNTSSRYGRRAKDDKPKKSGGGWLRSLTGPVG